MKRICVFCGSSPGVNRSYGQAGRRLGEALARAGLGVVYGGASIGVMGQVADAALACGGDVIGVIPRALARKEIAHDGLTRLHVVETMHERKAMMAELSDGFIALPGGMGTLDEFCEIVTWAQLGMHDKPCALLDVDGYFEPLVRLFDHAVAQGFMQGAHRDMILVEDDPACLLGRMRAYQAPVLPKWVTAGEV